MFKPQGQATLVGNLSSLGGPKTSLELDGEVDTFTCNHCQFIVHVPPRADPSNVGGLCRQCMGLICPKCVARGNCTPWEQTMEKMEAREDALRSYGL